MRMFLIFALAVSFLVVPICSYGKAMSELNMKEFSKEEEVSEDIAAKSPFAPVRPSPRDLLVQDLILSGVAIGDGEKYALISGYIVSEGDSIAGLRVKFITRSKVVLQYLDKVHTLFIDGGL